MFIIMTRSARDQLVRERDQGDDFAVHAEARIAELEAEVTLLRSQVAVRGQRGRFAKREGL